MDNFDKEMEEMERGMKRASRQLGGLMLTMWAFGAIILLGLFAGAVTILLLLLSAFGVI